jgi:hypothetical protein
MTPRYAHFESNPARFTTRQPDGRGPLQCVLSRSAAVAEERVPSDDFRAVIVPSENILIDTTLYQAIREQWQGAVSGMMAVSCISAAATGWCAS